jgi:hypothetical protein
MDEMDEMDQMDQMDELEATEDRLMWPGERAATARCCRSGA